MKRILFFCLLLSQLAFGVGRVTITRSYTEYSKQSAPKSVEIVQIAWVADSSDGSVPSTALFLSGQLVKAITVPGSTNPTANYDISLADSINSAVDAANATIQNRSASAAQQVYPETFLAGTYTFTLANNSVNSATGTLYLYMVDNSVIAASGSGGAVAGTSVTSLGATNGQVLTADGSGNSTWTTASGTGSFNGPVSSVTHDLVAFADTGGATGEDSGILTSAVVTKTGAMTLTNKTLTTPIIASISNTGTLTLPTSSDTLVGRATTDTLTNKTLTTPIIASISNSGTLTLPTSSDTLVGRATTDTLTNKTLTSPTISGSSLSIAKGNCRLDNVETDIGNTGSSQAIDLSTGNVWTGTLNTSSTFTFSNAANGCPYVFYLTQGSGGQTLTTAGITVIWGNSGTKTLSTASGAVDKIVCNYNGALSKLACDLATAYQ